MLAGIDTTVGVFLKPKINTIQNTIELSSVSNRFGTDADWLRPLVQGSSLTRVC